MQPDKLTTRRAAIATVFRNSGKTEFLTAMYQRFGDKMFEAILQMAQLTKGKK